MKLFASPCVERKLLNIHQSNIDVEGAGGQVRRGETTTTMMMMMMMMMMMTEEMETMIIKGKLCRKSRG